MDNGNHILDTHTADYPLLLNQLESIILDAKTVDLFSTDNINEMLHIVHALRASSQILSNVAAVQPQKEALNLIGII